MGFPANYLVEWDGYTLRPDLKSHVREGEAADLDFVERVAKFLDMNDLVATRREEPLKAQVAKIQIIVYGRSAAEVEETILAYGSRCDAASECPEVSFGECVIERNLDQSWGDAWAWRGRCSLTPRWPALSRALASEPSGE